MNTPEFNRYFLPVGSDLRMPQINDDMDIVLRLIDELGLKSVAGIISPEDLSITGLIKKLDEPQHSRQPEKVVAGPYIDDDVQPPVQRPGLKLYIIANPDSEE